MTKVYRLTATLRLYNLLMKAFLHLGVGPGGAYLLTVRGRKSGQHHTTPVTPVEESGQRWLVAPYGEVNWVRNARAAGRVSLTRGRRTESVEIGEVSPEEGGPVLRKYLTQVPLTRPYFDAKPDSPPESFVAEVARHPVFRIHSSGSR